MEGLIDQILEGTTPEANTVIQAEVKTQTTVQALEGGNVVKEAFKEEVLETKLLEKPSVYFSIKYSSTIPLGGFKSCKVEKSLFMPVGAEADQEIQKKIEKTNEWAKQTLVKLMSDEVKEALSEAQRSQPQAPALKEDAFAG